MPGPAHEMPSRGTLRPGSAHRLPPLKAPRLFDQLRERIRYLHYSRSTEEIYVYWCRSFIRFHELRHPCDMGGAEVEAFLTWLADERQVASATHKQALSALLFLYTKVLEVELPWVAGIERPRVRRRLPVVLSREEVAVVLNLMTDEHGLLARLLYGTGMRINEVLPLRVKDVDLRTTPSSSGRAGGQGQQRPSVDVAAIARRSAGGSTCRCTKIWTADAAAGKAGVELPHALERKYPRAGASWAWFWLFPQAELSTDLRSGACAAITFTTRRFSAPSSEPCRRRASPSQPRRTRCVTVSRPTCCSQEATSARCRSFSGTRI